MAPFPWTAVAACVSGLACVAAASTGDDPISTRRARTVLSDSSSKRAMVSSNTSWRPWTADTCPSAGDQFTGVDWSEPRSQRSARWTWPEAYQGVIAAGPLTADHPLEPGVRATRARVTSRTTLGHRHRSVTVNTVRGVLDWLILAFLLRVLVACVPRGIGTGHTTSRVAPIRCRSHFIATKSQARVLYVDYGKHSILGPQHLALDFFVAGRSVAPPRWLKSPGGSMGGAQSIQNEMPLLLLLVESILQLALAFFVFVCDVGWRLLLPVRLTCRTLRILFWRVFDAPHDDTVSTEITTVLVNLPPSPSERLRAAFYLVLYRLVQSTTVTEWLLTYFWNEVAARSANVALLALRLSAVLGGGCIVIPEYLKDCALYIVRCLVCATVERYRPPHCLRHSWGSSAKWAASIFLVDVLGDIDKVFHLVQMLQLRLHHRARYVLAFFVLVMVAYTSSADADAAKMAKAPLFDGTRTSYRPWLILFAAWLALRFPDLVGIFDNSEPMPGADQPDLRATWTRRNRQLYGAIIGAIPSWLATSLYLAAPNDGVGALNRLLQDFGARTPNDARLAYERAQKSWIASRQTLSHDVGFAGAVYQRRAQAPRGSS